MTVALAALPLLTAVVGLALRIKAPLAAGLALVVAGVVAWARFPVSAAQLSQAGRGILPTFVEVLAILFGGVLLSKIMDRTGAQSRIAGWIERCSAGRSQSAALLMVLGITPFAESVTGFGMGAVVAVPLLRHLGYRPTKAVILGLMGLFLTAWGALAPGTLVAATLGGVDLIELGVAAAWIAWLPILLTGLAALMVVDGPRIKLVHLGELLLLGGVLWLTLLGANALLGPSLAGAIGSLATVVAALIWFRVGGARISLDRPTAISLIPYAVLVGGLLTCTVALRAVDASGPVTLLTHGSVWLLVACVVAAVILHLPPAERRPALIDALRTWWPVGTATGGFLLLGTLLTTTGMSAEVARALASLGSAYLFLSSFVAGLGGYIAGSNAGANAMFAASQAEAAVQLGVPRLQLLAVQNVVCGVWTFVAPTRLALAVAVAGARDDLDVAAVTKVLLALAIAIATLIGLLTLAGFGA